MPMSQRISLRYSRLLDTNVSKGRMDNLPEGPLETPGEQYLWKILPVHGDTFIC